MEERKGRDRKINEVKKRSHLVRKWMKRGKQRGKRRGEERENESGEESGGNERRGKRKRQRKGEVIKSRPGRHRSSAAAHQET